MNVLARKPLFSLMGAAVLALSLGAVAPAHAGGGGGFASPTVKFMMKNGSKFHANTMQNAKKQLAADPTTASDGSRAEVQVYDLAPSGTGIVRRRWMPN
jgi:hypothetical protein